MKRALSLGLVAFTAALTAAPAHATGADAQASGTVTITVNIPPFAAALAAQAEGAVGLWTMVDSQSALMVKLPNSIDNSEGEVEAAVFTPASAPFSVSVTNPGMKIASGKVAMRNGLVRHGFLLRRSGTSVSTNVAPERVAMLVIAGV